MARFNTEELGVSIAEMIRVSREDYESENRKLREALLALRSVIHTSHVDMGGYHRYGISNGSPTGRAIMLADNALKGVE